LDRPLGLQGVEASRISKHPAYEVGKVVSLTHMPIEKKPGLLPSRSIPIC